MTRPLKKVDAEQVEKLAGFHCSLAEIASVVGCSVDTLERRFAEVIKKGREQGKASLRRRQFELAMAGNPTMLIWLGKQNLGQRDGTAIELTGKDGAPIEPAVSAKTMSDEEIGRRLMTLLERQRATVVSPPTATARRPLATFGYLSADCYDPVSVYHRVTC